MEAVRCVTAGRLNHSGSSGWVPKVGVENVLPHVGCQRRLAAAWDWVAGV